MDRDAVQLPTCLQVHVDGGFLADGLRGSFGIAITAWPERRFVSFVAGCFANAVHSLHAELFALRAAMQLLDSI